MDLDYDIDFKSAPVNTHTPVTLFFVLGPRAYFSLDHCDSTLPLSPSSALGPTCHPLEISYQYNNHGWQIDLLYQ